MLAIGKHSIRLNNFLFVNLVMGKSKKTPTILFEKWFI